MKYFYLYIVAQNNSKSKSLCEKTSFCALLLAFCNVKNAEIVEKRQEKILKIQIHLCFVP